MSDFLKTLEKLIKEDGVELMAAKKFANNLQNPERTFGNLQQQSLGQVSWTDAMVMDELGKTMDVNDMNPALGDVVKQDPKFFTKLSRARREELRGDPVRMKQIRLKMTKAEKEAAAKPPAPPVPAPLPTPIKTEKVPDMKQNVSALVAPPMPMDAISPPAGVAEIVNKMAHESVAVPVPVKVPDVIPQNSTVIPKEDPGAKMVDPMNMQMLFNPSFSGFFGF